MSPDINNLIITLITSDEAHIVFFTNSINFLISLSNQLFFYRRNQDVTEVE